MYDIGVALRRFKPLIRWTAWRSYRKLHMPFEDVEAEGFLVLVYCCREFPEGQKYFSRYFKRLWYNKIKNMYRHQRFQKRQGQEVELEQALSIPNTVDAFGRMRLKYEEICPLLSQDARKLLVELLEPSAQTVEVAYQDFCRRNRLNVQGQPVTGHKNFRIRLRHIRRVIGMSPSRMRNVVEEVKSVNRKLHRDGGS